jgi:hypothetical protein
MDTRQRAQREALTFTQREDGSLTNANMERYCLVLAEGLEPVEAWKAIGKKNQGGSVDYRKRVEAYAPFVARLASLTAEREELMKDDLFGEMKWMANQLWREARAKGDTAGATKAAELRWKILEKESAMRTVAPDQPAGRPGKPAVENPQTQHDLSGLKARLASMGAPVPGDANVSAAQISSDLNSLIDRVVI